MTLDRWATNRSHWQRLATVGLLWLCATTARAADVPADPSNYRDLLSRIQPGDVLQLAPGEYARLNVEGVHGTAEAWITIEGPSEGEPAVITSEACCNTVQIGDTSFVAVRNLTVDAQGLFVDPINAKGSPSHDILIEGNTLQGFPADSQQIVGINTKVTVWNWTIRGNRIIEPGTGLYLGDSDGGAPFVAGVIEGNVVVNPTGYCMQIKHQNSYAAADGMPEGPNRTLVHNNVFLKDDRLSPDGDRPNLLVGGFPDEGYGSDDRYEVYGNVLLGNPREALFQATGSFSVHDNLFVGVGDGQTSLMVTEHQGKTVRVAHVYNNTIFGGARGVHFSAGALESNAVVANLVFSTTPIGGSITDERGNLVDAVDNAGDYVNAPSLDPDTMDFYPQGDAALGTPEDLSVFSGDVASLLDFNGTPKMDVTFRGAYAGAGDNPGCTVAELIEDPLACAPDGGDDSGGETSGDGGESGADDTGPGASSTTSGGASSATLGEGDGTRTTSGTATEGSAGEVDEDSSGCGCRSTPDSGRLASWLLLGLVGLRRRAWPTGLPNRAAFTSNDAVNGSRGAPGDATGRIRIA